MAALELVKVDEDGVAACADARYASEILTHGRHEVCRAVRSGYGYKRGIVRRAESYEADFRVDEFVDVVN